ncbi:DUF1990 family protein [Arthrobacter sp. VKM Ac-2550]|uniref:DUF1990 family protein n=1 Tax=Crystallibacter permensis TaxID=1938888 RepID=UPI0022277C33|nr:DUF1990 domain-containing protein [Arthrobacter sp. VKM Ac-2550]MCW2130958.1 Uncharacterized protein, UPF0548 family [Arthrobacter sp. VKM Ac-2550]
MTKKGDRFDVDAELTYAEHGWTQSSRAPAGYRVARHRVVVGEGRDAFSRLAGGILGWELHRLAGLNVRAQAPRAGEGVHVVPGFGFGRLRLAAPCRVVWVEEGTTRAGFGYGTLPGHPETGEECFVAVLEPDGQVYFELFAFSRHSNWFYKLGGLVASACQRLVTRRYLAAARKLASGIPTDA